MLAAVALGHATRFQPLRNQYSVLYFENQKVQQHESPSPFENSVKPPMPGPTKVEPPKTTTSEPDFDLQSPPIQFITEPPKREPPKTVSSEPNLNLKSPPFKYIAEPPTPAEPPKEVSSEPPLDVRPQYELVDENLQQKLGAHAAVPSGFVAKIVSGDQLVLVGRDEQGGLVRLKYKDESLERVRSPATPAPTPVAVPPTWPPVRRRRPVYRDGADSGFPNC